MLDRNTATPHSSLSCQHLQENLIYLIYIHLIYILLIAFQVHLRVPCTDGTHLVHDAAREAVHLLHCVAGISAPAAALLRPHLYTRSDRVERQRDRGVPPGDVALGARLHRRRSVLHQLLSVPGVIRESAAVHHFGDPEHFVVCGAAAGAGAAQAALPREPEEGVQKAERLQLHHPHADCGCVCLSDCRNTHCRRHLHAHRQLADHRVPRLWHRQRLHSADQLLSGAQLSDQLWHLLRHVAPVSRDLQGDLHGSHGRQEGQLVEVLDREWPTHLHQHQRDCPLVIGDVGAAAWQQRSASQRSGLYVQRRRCLCRSRSRSRCRWLRPKRVGGNQQSAAASASASTSSTSSSSFSAASHEQHGNHSRGANCLRKMGFMKL